MFFNLKYFPTLIKEFYKNLFANYAQDTPQPFVNYKTLPLITYICTYSSVFIF